MSITGPRMKQEVHDSIEFVIKNLRQQYVIPHYAKGYYEATTEYDDKVNSKLAVSITVKNLTKYPTTNTEPDFTISAIDHIGALDILAKVSVDDNLSNDEWGNDRIGNEFLAFFGTDSSSYTETKEVMIYNNNFEVSVTYTRSYLRID